MPPGKIEVAPERDYRRVVVVRCGSTVSVYQDDAPVSVLMTGSNVQNYYVPTWWAGTYKQYIMFIGALQVLYQTHRIQANRLVRSVSPLSLTEAEKFVREFCKA